MDFQITIVEKITVSSENLTAKLEELRSAGKIVVKIADVVQ